MLNGQKIIVVMPAYNAAKTLEQTHRDLPLEFIDEVILADDASEDRTAELALKTWSGDLRAPQKSGLRPQSKNLLPRGSQPRRRHRGDGASGLSVFATFDRFTGRDDCLFRVRRRAGLAHSGRFRAEGRDAPVQIYRQPFFDVSAKPLSGL